MTGRGIDVGPGEKFRNGFVGSNARSEPRSGSAALVEVDRRRNLEGREDREAEKTERTERTERTEGRG